MPVFAMPGGESSGSTRHRPVDLAHLARQTMGDRDLEREVLELFTQQAVSVRDRITRANTNELLLLALGLKGSARSVGALAIAECAVDLENEPRETPALSRGDRLRAAVRHFIPPTTRRR